MLKHNAYILSSNINVLTLILSFSSRDNSLAEGQDRLVHSFHFPMYVMGATTGVTATMTDISMMPRLLTGNLLKQESSQEKEFISQMRNFLG